MGLEKPKQPAFDPYSAFLNIPYDTQFENLYLAFIAGITAFGLIPKARIFGLIKSCGCSLSLVFKARSCKYS